MLCRNMIKVYNLKAVNRYGQSYIVVKGYSVKIDNVITLFHDHPMIYL